MIKTVAPIALTLIAASSAMAQTGSGGGPPPGYFSQAIDLNRASHTAATRQDAPVSEPAPQTPTFRRGGMGGSDNAIVQREIATARKLMAQNRQQMERAAAAKPAEGSTEEMPPEVSPALPPEIMPMGRPADDTKEMHEYIRNNPGVSSDVQPLMVR